ncbi:MAG TPA: phosphatidylserine decarboxylase [Synergistaceae bacterium]|nr:phosphatidylserine decarboxylase [Synergistaceae bacterium]HQK26097.1 phosphatidylserine decarboxylase [Synergistaceae bacterium]
MRPVARDGFPLIGGVALACAAGGVYDVHLALGILPLLALVIWFFRDPERTTTAGPGSFVSPADGKVVEVGSAFHPFVGNATRVGIFMSPLDVHVNRAPFAGIVAHLEYVPGARWMAFDPKASERNERFFVGLDTAVGPVIITQVAGFLARRIVCRLIRGDRLERGERYGMIKLGSRVDLYLPPAVECVVAVGQRVRAGETTIGVVRDGPETQGA